MYSGDYESLFQSNLQFIRPNYTSKFPFSGLSVSERIELYFQDDLRDARLLSIDGWWNHVEMLMRGRGRLPSYIQNVLFDDDQETVGIRGQVDGHPFLFDTFLSMCNCYYNSAVPFYAKHPFKDGVCDNMCVLVTNGKDNIPSTLRIDYRMFIYLFYLMSLDRWEDILSSIIEYTWRWMAIHFLSVSSFFSGPKDSFKESSWTKERVEAVEELAKKDGSYTTFQPDKFPKLRKPHDDWIPHPIGRNVEETLMTIEMVRRLIDDRCGTADVEVFGAYDPESDMVGYDEISYNQKFCMITNLIRGVMHKTRDLLLRNGLTKPFKTSMLFKRRYRKGEYTEYGPNDKIGSFTGDVILTKRELQKTVGFTPRKRAFGFCPHPCSRNSVILVPEVTDLVHDWGGRDKRYDVRPTFHSKHVTLECLRATGNCIIGVFDEKAIANSELTRTIFWTLPKDCEKDYSEWISMCSDNPDWHYVRDEDIITCDCGMVVCLERGHCQSCECEAFDPAKHGCAMCGHTWQEHEIKIPVPDEIKPELVEPKFRMFEPCSYERRDYMCIGGGYIYKSRDNWKKKLEK
jgi:hypothetical protein